MKTIFLLAMILFSLPSFAQTKGAAPNELIPFYFEKSGVQISVYFRHSLIYASTRSFMVNPEADLQPNPFLSFEFLPTDKYFSCASKQLEILGEALKSKEVAPLKNKYQSILLTVLISPTTAASTFCPTVLRSSQKQLVLNVCLDDSLPNETSCQTITSARIAAHYTKRDDMQSARQKEESRMKKAAESILQWMQP
jgi:hypothetical protein